VEGNYRQKPLEINGWKMKAFRNWGTAYVQGHLLLLVSGSAICFKWFGNHIVFAACHFFELSEPWDEKLTMENIKNPLR